MAFKISKLDRETLVRIEPLLSASVGYQTSLPDELESFDSIRPGGWLYAHGDNNKPLGFVRSFNQGHWSHGELFVLPGYERYQIATQLLVNFLELNSFESGHRLRFDVTSSDSELVNGFEALGLSEKSQTFFYYDFVLPAKNAIPESFFEPVSASEVASVLSHLHPVTIEEADSWIQNKTIRTVSHEGQVVAAAQVFNYGDSAEINRIATSENFLRRGFSRRLLNKICDELSANGVKRLFLKVEDTRTPAIRFYEDFGFKKHEDKTQTWFSKYF